MGLDFDPIDYCRTLNRSPPPFKCPVEKCNKSYKSIYGLQYHLVNYDHDTNTQINHVTPVRKKSSNRNTSTSATGKKTSPIAAAIPSLASPKEGLTYLEALKVVQFEIDGKSIKVSTVDPIPLITDEDFNEMVAKGEANKHQDLAAEPHIKLPEASVKRIENYTICDAPQRPNAYIRFIEKSPEEMDGEIEYDVDEEDTAWLQQMNESRAESGTSAVSIDMLELLMDRLEKESYFQAVANGHSGSVVDDDAVCCICMDGECQNTNVILFCDMCNLAVHQDCYGVPYIPEGQWLCRRCLQSPSRPVDCVLCPNAGGAFKQTDHNQWAHVVCALWIPEVRFANTVFLEPIDSIETIPAARWRLTCYICKQKGVGACIQCQRNSCYAAFHVTCAQQAGLHMRMDTVKDSSNEVHPITVQKVAYCDAHCPTNNGGNGENTNLSSVEAEKLRQKSRIKMKQARKMLAMKRESVPVIMIPTIPPDRVQEITSLAHFPKKAQFIQRLIAYWTLKRQNRNGVPLLRRLQSQGQTHGGRGIEGSPNASELNQQLKYWQCLRQDLERARLLCELVRKREKLKAVLIRTTEQCVMMNLNPLEAAMHRILDALDAKDNQEIFTEPVDTDEVPDYMDVVKEPMDLGTMRKKLNMGEYFSLDEMEADFTLMIQNCLAYNNKDTIFYRAGVRMRDQCLPIFKSTRKELIRNGILEEPQTDESLAREIDHELADLLKTEKPSETLLDKLQVLSEKVQRIKHGMVRTKRVKQIRTEITKAKKVMNRNSSFEESPSKKLKIPNNDVERMQTDSSQSEDEEVKKDERVMLQQSTPPCSPLKLTNNSASPSGVNRRTAVLFTRKAQAAASLKRTELTQSDELSATNPVDDNAVRAATSHMSPNQSDTKIKSPKKFGKSKRNNSHGIESNSGHLDETNTGTTTVSTQPTLNVSNTAMGPNKKLSPSMRDKYRSSEAVSESFRRYRDRGMLAQSSDSDESQNTLCSDSCSSCSQHNSSDCCSSLDDDDDDDDDDDGDMDDFGRDIPDAESASTSTGGSLRKKNDEIVSSMSGKLQSNSTYSETSNTAAADDMTYEPLQLVWAKCRGYPWYPALIIDPKMPTGYIYNGVPLPTPPTEVLALRKDKEEPVYLVLFFDAKRTWQWLPPNKLEMLGFNEQQDKGKLTESRKQSKAVRKAYDDALKYHSQVTDLEGQGPGAIM